MLGKILSKIQMVLFRLLGNDYRIKSLRKRGVKIGEHCLIFNTEWGNEPYLIEIGNHVVVAGGATFLTHDGAVWVFREQEPDIDLFGKIKVGNNCVLSLNTIILPNTIIGDNCVIGAGAVVMMDVPPNAIVFGNPARIEGYTSTLEPILRVNKEAAFDSGLIREINVNGVRFMKMPMVTDLRGILSYGEYDKQLPFVPRRYFVVADVPSKDVRGEHAHRKLHQLLICVKGSCCVALDDGYNRDKVILDTLDKALYIPPMVWASQYKYSQDAVLLVLASDEYDADSYIRDYDAFIGLVKKN